jgi:signal peptide peptidase SppA
MHPMTFSSPYFAMLESYAAQLLAGDATPRRPAPPMAAGQIGIFGALGQNDSFVQTDYTTIRSNLRRALADPKVKTIDLVIDSPGGAVIGLPETHAAIREANRIKPVRAFVPGIAASAAYWLASAASTITLTPSGQVGSVGVLDIHADISKSLENQGVALTVVTAGPHKAERAPFTPLSDDARAHIQSGVDEWYGEFLRDVRRGRGARVAANSDFGGGRMLTAKQALQAGMVDFVQAL